MSARCVFSARELSPVVPFHFSVFCHASSTSLFSIILPTDLLFQYFANCSSTFLLPMVHLHPRSDDVISDFFSFFISLVYVILSYKGRHTKLMLVMLIRTNVKYQVAIFTTSCVDAFTKISCLFHLRGYLCQMGFFVTSVMEQHSTVYTRNITYNISRYKTDDKVHFSNLCLW